MRKRILIFIFVLFIVNIFCNIDFMTIKEARTKKVLTPVIIEGVVTVEPGKYDYSIIFVQDDTAGVNIYYQGKDLRQLGIERNDLVRITGRIWIHRNNVQVSLDPALDTHKIEIIEKNYKTIEPRVIKTSEIENNNELKGLLVKTQGKITKVADREFFIDDGSGEGRIYIREGTGINPLNFREGLEIEIIGTLGRFSLLHNLWPRDNEDIIAEDIFPPDIKYYSVETENTFLLLFDKPIKQNITKNQMINVLGNTVTNINYLYDNSLLEVETELPIINQRVILRSIEDLNGNRLMMKNFNIDYEKNKIIKNVLFDEAHAQTAGNADWVITGAFSDFGDMILDLGKNVYAEKMEISEKLLNLFGMLILPEPNRPYTSNEIKAMLNFVKNGGGLFIIADHVGADRNNNGWDSVKIFNEFVYEFGFLISEDNLGNQEPVPYYYDHEITKGISKVGVWSGASITILDKNKVEVLIAAKNKLPYVVLTEYGKGLVVAIGDSSPFDDGDGDLSSVLYDGWNWGDNAKLAENIIKYFYNNLK